jgi:hypothetical protein
MGMVELSRLRPQAHPQKAGSAASLSPSAHVYKFLTADFPRRSFF